jgi:hypothetical protein
MMKAPSVTYLADANVTFQGQGRSRFQYEGAASSHGLSKLSDRQCSIEKREMPRR